MWPRGDGPQRGGLFGPERRRSAVDATAGRGLSLRLTCPPVWRAPDSLFSLLLETTLFIRVAKPATTNGGTAGKIDGAGLGRTRTD